jgi:DNA-binding NarL/FixJ family response regulator
MMDAGDPGRPIRVLVADDQAIIRDGLVTVLGLLSDVEIVGAAADGHEAVALAVERHPDVVLMDLRMPVMDGVEATRRLRADVPDAAVLVLTTYADDDSILAALRAGAAGYLTKDAGRAELAAAVRAVARGQAILGAEAQAVVMGSLSATAPSGMSTDAVSRRFPELTAREAEVLALAAGGLGNREIAAKLFIGVSTVKTHVNGIFAKLDVRTREEAVALARGEAERRVPGS